MLVVATFACPSRGLPQADQGITLSSAQGDEITIPSSRVTSYSYPGLPRRLPPPSRALRETLATGEIATFDSTTAPGRYLLRNGRTFKVGSGSLEVGNPPRWSLWFGIRSASRVGVLVRRLGSWDAGASERQLLERYASRCLKPGADPAAVWSPTGREKGSAYEITQFTLGWSGREEVVFPPDLVDTMVVTWVAYSSLPTLSDQVESRGEFHSPTPADKLNPWWRFQADELHPWWRFKGDSAEIVRTGRVIGSVAVIPGSWAVRRFP